MSFDGLHLCDLGLLSSSSRVNQDAYSAPGGPPDFNTRLPTPGRRSRSNTPDEEDSDRATKRRRTPSEQVYEACSEHHPSSQKPRPHQLSSSRRRQSGPGHARLPDFIEGSSRDTGRERRRRINRRSSPGPPAPMAAGPTLNRDAEDQKESEDLMSTADVLFNIAWNICAGTKLRKQDIVDWRHKWKGMLQLSMSELQRLVGEPHGWRCKAPAPSTPPITLPPLRNAPASPKTPVTLPPLRNNEPALPRTPVSLPPLRTVVNYYTPFSQTIPAVLDSSPTRSYYNTVTSSSNLRHPQERNIYPHEYSSVPDVLPEMVQPQPGPTNPITLPPLRTVVNYSTPPAPNIPAVVDSSPNQSYHNTVGTGSIDNGPLQEGNIHGPPTYSSSPKTALPQDGEVQGHVRIDGPSLNAGGSSNGVRQSNAQGVQSLGSQRRDALLREVRPRLTRRVSDSSYIYPPRSERPAENTVLGHEEARRYSISPEGAAPSRTRQLVALWPVPIPRNFPALREPHPQLHNPFQAVLQYAPSHSPVASGDNGDD